MLLHNHPSGLLEPSGADLNVAARLHDGGVGFGIVDNGATELYVVVEVPRDRPVVRDRSVRRDRHAGREAARSRAELGAVRGSAAASATWRRTSPTATTTAGCCCSRREPGWGSRSPIWCRRWPGRGPTASAPSSAPTRSTCRSSWSARTCRCCARALEHGRLHADLRAAQGMAELPLPGPAAPGGGGPAHAAGAGQARRADRHRGVGRATPPTAR